MPAGPMTETRRARRSRLVAWNRSLSRRSSSSRPTNGASSASARFRPPRSATTRSARQAGTGAAFPLSDLLSGRLERDRGRRGPLRRLADEHGARGGDRLETGRRVDEIAGHHPLVRGPEGDRGLAGQDSGPGLDRRTQRPDGVDELEACPNGSLGVVLVRRWRAPDGHDRVADELLDRPAVPLDDVAGQVEVAGQQLPRRPPRRAPRRAS